MYNSIWHPILEEQLRKDCNNHALCAMQCGAVSPRDLSRAYYLQFSFLRLLILVFDVELVVPHMLEV